MRKTILGGIAVTATLGAMLASGATAAGPAGKPQAFSETLCGFTMTDPGATATPNGQSNEDRFGPVQFMVSEQKPGTTCENSNSQNSDGSTWTIGHGNVNPTTERGTEHGQYALASQTRQGGFNGHVTDWNFSGSDSCTSGDRTVYYQSGNKTDCPPDFGPVGNFNTHGGAATGDHSRGKYGTIIFQQGDQTDGGCYVGSAEYCIQVDLAGQIN